jgi:hypothetical protein
MKLTIKLSSLALALIGLVSCGDGASKDLAKELKSSYDKDGQQVELVGYITVRHSEVVKGGKITVGFDNVAGQPEASLADIELSFGQGPNMVYMPKKFKSSDLEVYDKDGNKHGYLDEVKITGTVKYTNKNWKESIDRENSGGIASKTHAMVKKRAQEAADKREKETGDPNDYSFYIIGEKIEITQ